MLTSQDSIADPIPIGQRDLVGGKPLNRTIGEVGLLLRDKFLLLVPNHLAVVFLESKRLVSSRVHIHEFTADEVFRRGSPGFCQGFVGQFESAFGILNGNKGRNRIDHLPEESPFLFQFFFRPLSLGDVMNDNDEDTFPGLILHLADLQLYLHPMTVFMDEAGFNILLRIITATEPIIMDHDFKTFIGVDENLERGVRDRPVFCTIANDSLQGGIHVLDESILVYTNPFTGLIKDAQVIVTGCFLRQLLL